MTSLGRYAGLLVIVAFCVAWWLLPIARYRSVSGTTASATPTALPVPTAPVAGGALGVGSCAAAACHGNPLLPLPQPEKVSNLAELRPVNSWESCYQQWMCNDRHARAYDTLDSDLSKQIMKKLKGGGDARKEEICLACHSNPSIASKTDLISRELHKEGVSCEACHGNAHDWRTPHTAWTPNTDRDKAYSAVGMKKLYDVSVRAETCMACHVGAGPTLNTPLMDVNHDLIGAGHPRLNFEYATYLRTMSPHWREKDRTKGNIDRAPGFEADVWRIGQATQMEMTLKLLEVRSGMREIQPTPPWPEFAEFNCYACHHDLKPASWRGPTSSKPKQTYGAFVWNRPEILVNPGNDSALDKAVKLTDEIETAVNKTFRGGSKVSTLKDKTDQTIAAWRDWRKSLPVIDQASLANLVGELKHADPLYWEHLDWDQACRLYQAMIAIENARRQLGIAEPPGQAARTKRLYDGLVMNRDLFDSPVKYDPKIVRKDLRDWVDGK